MMDTNHLDFNVVVSAPDILCNLSSVVSLTPDFVIATQGPVSSKHTLHSLRLCAFPVCVLSVFCALKLPSPPLGNLARDPLHCFSSLLWQGLKWRLLDSVCIPVEVFVHEHTLWALSWTPLNCCQFTNLNIFSFLPSKGRFVDSLQRKKLYEFGELCLLAQCFSTSSDTYCLINVIPIKIFWNHVFNPLVYAHASCWYKISSCKDVQTDIKGTYCHLSKIINFYVILRQNQFFCVNNLLLILTTCGKTTYIHS